MSRLAGGEITAFDEIYASYGPIVYNEAFRMLRSSDLAKDVVQEVFTLVWDKREGFSGVTRLRAYLITITKNLVYQYFLRQSRDRVADREFSDSSAGVIRDTEQMIRFNELESYFQNAVDSLPDRQREVYTLANEEGLDYDTIASRMNISRNTVKNHLAAARNFIRKCLQHAALSLCWLLMLFSA